LLACDEVSGETTLPGRMFRRIKSTDKCKDTLNPEFSEESRSFVFRDLEGSWAIQIKLMDWNRWSQPRILGEVILLPHEFQNGQQESKWYKLKADSNLFRYQEDDWGTDLGYVQLNIAISSSPDFGSRRSTIRQRASMAISKKISKMSRFSSGRGIGLETQSSSSSSLFSSGRQLISDLPWSEEDASMTREPNILRLIIGAATEISSQGDRRTSKRKLFCRVSYRGSRFDTEKRTDYIWNQETRLPRHHDGATDSLKIELREPILAGIDSRRICQTYIQNLAAASTGLLRLELKPRGYIQLGYRLEYDAKFDASTDAQWFADFAHQDIGQPEESIPDELHVVICRARGLKASDPAIFGPATSDPYAKLKIIRDTIDNSDDGTYDFCGGTWAQTNVIKKTLDPIWNARFALPLNTNELLSDDNPPLLLVEVYDKDQFTSDDFLGRALIPISKSVGQERARTQRTEWFRLEGDESEEVEGELLVATYARSSAPSSSSSLQSTTKPRWRPESETDLLSAAPNELRVCIAHCSLGESKGDLSIIFTVLRPSTGDVIQEWESRRIQPGDWREAMAWPLKPRSRDDDFELRATIVDAEESKIVAGNIRLSELVEARPAPSERILTPYKECGRLELILQWRHNKALVVNRIGNNDMLFEFGIDEEDEEQIAPLPQNPTASRMNDPTIASQDQSRERKLPPPSKRRPTLPSIVRRVRAGNVQAVRPLHANALLSYAAFVPAFVSREIAARRTSTQQQAYTYGQALQFDKQVEAAVLFADISGFTKLTEKLCARLNGAELLCAELDVIYGALCDEANFLGGDAVKFAGDAICFAWIVSDDDAGGIDLATATRRAALCAQLAHIAVRQHPPVEGVKLTLHAGLSCGRLNCLALTRERPPGQRERAEFVIAGTPMEHIGIAEPLAGPGTTVCSPDAWKYLSQVFEGEDTQEPGYVRLGLPKVPEEEVCSTPSCGLMSATLKLLRTSDIVHMSPFVPKAFDRILRNKHATATFVAHAKHAKAEIRELTVAFLKFEGVDMGDSDQLDKARAMVRVVDWVVSLFDGSVNKLLVDDKGTLALIVFGLPGNVHANAPARCVAAVRLIHERLEGIMIQCSIGVTTARAFCGAVGSRQRMEYTVMGDSVNLAARLMAASATSHRPCLVDENTRKFTRDEVEYKSHDPIKVKGKSEAISIFEPIRFYEDDQEQPHQYSYGTADLLRFESHRTKLQELRGICDNVFGQSEPPKRIAVCVVKGLEGTNAAADLVRSLPEVCADLNVAVLRCFKSHSIYADGVLRATTVAGAWRGPIAAAIAIIAGSKASNKLDTELLTQALDDLDPVTAGMAQQALADMFRSDELPDDWSYESGRMSVAFAKNADAQTIKRGKRVADFVLETIKRAARIKPLCIILDNLGQMDTTAWDIADKLARDTAFFSSPIKAGSTCRPVMLCLLAPRSAHEGLRRAEWTSIANIGTNVEVSPLQPEEAILFAAEVLELCAPDDPPERREAAALAISRVERLVEFVESSKGVRDVLKSMLLDAKEMQAIQIIENDGTNFNLRVSAGVDLLALPPPQVHAGIVLAVIDSALSMQEHIVVRASSIFREGFTPTLIHNLCPINIEPTHISDILRALCKPLDSGRKIFESRPRDPDFLRSLTAAGPNDEEVFFFVEPLLQKSIADTLLDAQLKHVLNKMDMLPITGLRHKNWKSALLHPFLARKFANMRLTL